MSLKRKPAPAAKKRPTMKAKGPQQPKSIKEVAERISDLPPAAQKNVLVLPAPELVAERQQADALIQKLTDTLPARLDDEVGMGQASEHLIITRKLRKAFEDKLKELKKPIDKALDDLKNDYKPYIVRLETTEGTLNRLLSDYRAEATRKQAVEDERIRKEHQANMDLARDQGVNPLSIPVPQAAAAPPTGFQTAHGKTTTMRVPRWRCTDPGAVPYEYAGTKLWMLNDAGIGTIRRGAGVEAKSPIPGIEFYYDETTVVK